MGAFLLLSDCFLHCLVTDLANETCSCFSCKNFHKWHPSRGCDERRLSQVGLGRDASQVGLRRRLIDGIGEKSLTGGIGDVEQLKASLLFQRSDSTGGLSPARE